MKRLILCLALISTGCGANLSPNSLTSTAQTSLCTNGPTGIWERLPGPSEILTLNADCTGTFAPGSIGLTYSLISQTQARIVYDDGTEAICSFEVTDTGAHLLLNCGGGVVTYTSN